jgi:hypothetical protein
MFPMLKCAFEVCSGRERQTDEQRTVSVQNLEMVEDNKKKVTGMAKLVTTINNVPSLVTASKPEENSVKNPSNLITGIGYGGIAIAKGIFDGVTGIFVEPYKGGKDDGLTGVAKGLGRGLLGVVAKPLGGVAGFV